MPKNVAASILVTKVIFQTLRLMHFKNKKNALLVFVFLFTFVLAMNWITRKGAIQRDKLLLFPLLHSKLFSRDNCSICD